MAKRADRGNKLDLWLRDHGITQAEASRILKVAQATLHRIRNGEPPTLRNAARIVAATDGQVTYVDLLGPTVWNNLHRFNGTLKGRDPKIVKRERFLADAKVREAKRQARRAAEAA